MASAATLLLIIHSVISSRQACMSPSIVNADGSHMLMHMTGNGHKPAATHTTQAFKALATCCCRLQTLDSLHSMKRMTPIKQSPARSPSPSMYGKNGPGIQASSYSQLQEASIQVSKLKALNCLWNAICVTTCQYWC